MIKADIVKKSNCKVKKQIVNLNHQNVKVKKKFQLIIKIISNLKFNIKNTNMKLHYKKINNFNRIIVVINS